MESETSSYFDNLKNPAWVRKKRMHYLVMPEWADGKSMLVCICAVVSFTAGVGSCFLLHGGISSSGVGTVGLVIWLAGAVAILINTYLYMKGMYYKFLDLAWDAYY